jgi:SNF2 family DNA or RNA helicase
VRLPRAPQLAMLRGMSRSPRHQLIASMGLGKSAAILMHASSIEFTHGYWPGLMIFAPLQVCYSWRNEVPLWRPDLRVNLICGPMEQRKAAVATPGDINVVSYDTLPWLEANGPENWAQAFGQMAICDESTRIKKTRASWQTSSLGKHWLRTDGGVQTNALARQSANFAWWVNATGTPTPNGLVDLWGQIWYLDNGHRLGNSFTAFEQRWFRIPNRHTDFAKPEPLPGAPEEIASRIADITTVVKVEDWFDVAKPNVVDRFVEMPAKAQKAYAEMREKMITQIRTDLLTNTVTAQSAAAKVSKLLQISNGFAYHRDEDLDPDLQLCTELHEVKLDDIESVLEETGEPLVVVYFFQANLEQLKRRFKKRLVELDKNGRAQDLWNAGKVEILALQYRKGAMGLSLQHGGRNIYLMTPTFIADDYAQVLERLGPLRQMQSGYNRVVNVFRCISRKSEDARVFAVAEGKIALETALVEMIRDA